MYGEGKTRGKCSKLCIAVTTNQALAALQVGSAMRSWTKMFPDHNYDNTRRIASGGVLPNLNLGLIRAIRLPLPQSASGVASFLRSTAVFLSSEKLRLRSIQT
jgi:type I restriction enzyme S subunit